MIKEKKINNLPDPISIKGTQRILSQMMNCICKIKLKGKSGTGFFLQIPYENNLIKALLTNYHIIDENYYYKNKEINILLNDEKEAKTIDLTKKRETYFNEEYDIAIIELKENDNISNYLELDDNIFKTESKAFYEDKSIYVLQYPGNNVLVSYGLLTGINKFDIKHTCNTDNGSSGSPILNLNTFKVIGIHKEGSNIFNFNKGTLLKFPLNNFINNIKNKSTNILMINDINDQNTSKDDSQNQLINDFENNFNMMEYQKYMMIGYHINMLKSYINTVIDDGMIYYVMDDLLFKNEIIKFNVLNTIKTRSYYHWFSVDFTNDNDIEKIHVKFQYDTGYRSILIINYDITIEEMLDKFLFAINKSEMKSYVIDNKIVFLYNGSLLKHGDKNPAGKYFKNNKNPKIMIIDIRALLVEPWDWDD